MEPVEKVRELVTNDIDWTSGHVFVRCHGLVPWSLTFAATCDEIEIAGCHGLAPSEVHVSRLNSKQREAPRDKRVASISLTCSSVAPKR